MQAWIEESLKNGELFFYIVPAVLLLLLLIVIFWPDKKKRTKEEIEETELDKLIKADKKLKAEIEPVVENKEEPPFKEAGKEIQLFEEKQEPEPEPKPVETSPETSHEPERPAEPEQLAATIKSGLEKTKKGGFMSRLLGLFKNSVVDDDLIDELEEILYTADMGVTTVSWLMDLVNKNRSKFTSGDDVKQFLKEQIREVLVANHKPFPEITEKPTIFLMVGVNGAGKTTTIGKLAHKFIAQGKVPMLAAGDTFRAAAVEQLKVWGERNNCTVISDKDGADPASVAFNA
ncbi:signal recognition particle receptor subunit alpha, partial [bacterium]|nr:signal recognition particle receptor subunit alpha [bacterium]